MLLRASLLSCFFALAVSSSAKADVIPGTKQNILGWQLAAYDKTPGGPLSHCGMYIPYNSGIVMHFKIFADYQWQVGWSHQSWNFATGQQVPVAIFVDGNGPHHLAAVARSKDFATADLPANAGIFDLMRKGYRMTVNAEGREYLFNLDGTYAALTAVLACVDRFMKPAAPPAPIVGTSTTKPAVASSRINAEDRLEATKVVANILAQGEMMGFRILSSKELEDSKSEYLQKSDVVWRAEGVFGTLRIIPKFEGGSQEIVAAVMADDAKSCKGQFASGTTKDDKNSGVMRLFTGCKDDSGAFEYRYTVVPLANGNSYLFAMMSKSSSSDQERKTTEATKADIMLRQAVFEVLKK